MMTDFSFHRVVLLCKKLIGDYKPWVKVLIIYCVGLPLALEFVSGYNYDMLDAADYKRNTIVHSLIQISLTCVMSASFFLNSLSQKRSRISFLTLPVSNKEKFVANWLVFVLGAFVFITALTLIFMPIKILALRVIFPSAAENIPMIDWSVLLNTAEITLEERKYFVFDRIEPALTVLGLYFFVHSLFVLGATVWEKNSGQKTLLSIIVMGFIYGWSINYLLGFISSAHVLAMDFNAFMNQMNIYVVFAVILLLSLFNTVLAYYRFKETDVVHRY